MKLSELHVVNSVKVGKKQPTFLRFPEYDMTLLEDNVRILIIDKEGNEVYTSIMNAPWWKELKESKPSKKKNDEPSKSTSSTKRTSKKKRITTKLV